MQFHPRNDRQFLVCPMRHAAVLVDVDGEHKVVPLDDEVSRNEIDVILFLLHVTFPVHAFTWLTLLC